MQNNSVNPSYSSWPKNQNTQIPQTGTNMQGAPNGLFQTQEGDETMVIRSEGSRKHGYQMVKYRIVNGGNSGPILVSVANPTNGIDNKERRGEVCPTCAKGILLLDMDCVREQSGFSFCICNLPLMCCFMCPIVSWPCVCGFCCYLKCCKKRICTSCNAEFPTAILRLNR